MTSQTSMIENEQVEITNRLFCRCYFDGDKRPFHYFYRNFELFSRHTDQLQVEFPNVTPRSGVYFVLGGPALIAELNNGCGIVEGNFDYDDPKPGEICNY